MTKRERILVVDDEEDILELVRYNLVDEGFEVICADTGEQALKIAEAEQPDLILLDLMLPGINGIEVAKTLKHSAGTCHIPIIMLTAKGEEADVVLGLETGADDYVTKPFSPQILNARAKAVIRRTAQDTIDTSSVIQIQDLTIDPRRRKTKIRGKDIDLSYTEFQILQFLSRRPGWVFTRSQIVDAVRGDNYPVTDRSVDVQIVGLRKKMGSCASYIQTVRGVGYRFKEIS